MAILITGAAGFIGSSLCEELLKQGKNIIGIDNFDAFYAREIKESNIKNCLKNKNFKFYEADLTDIDALKEVFAQNQINQVIHLAAKSLLHRL